MANRCTLTDEREKGCVPYPKPCPVCGIRIGSHTKKQADACLERMGLSDD